MPPNQHKQRRNGKGLYNDYSYEWFPQIRMIFLNKLNIRGINFSTHCIAERGKNYFDGLAVYRNYFSLLLYQRSGINFYDIVKMYIHLLKFNETMFAQKSF